jgi:Zn-dependent peptidase ImmA (M78 family)
VPEDLIANLPRIEVMRTSPFPASGATQWTRGRWLIVLNSSEAYVRQRFSLAHELKHIIDHPFVGQLYGGVDAGERAAWAEQVCDYFAGCLLMPRPWLKRAWTTETQDIAVLARRFHVSQAAMSTRLHQTGIMPPKPRCTPGDDWLRRAVAEVARTARYQRQAPSPILIGGLVT